MVSVSFESCFLRLSWRPLVCTSSSMADKVAVNKALADLGATKMSNVWTDDVTHLVMDEIILTIKANYWIVLAQKAVQLAKLSSVNHTTKAQETWVLLDNVGPLNFKNLSEICLKTVKKLSVSKYCQKTVRNVSDICQYSVRCQTLSEKCLNKFGNVSKKCLRP